MIANKLPRGTQHVTLFCAVLLSLLISVRSGHCDNNSNTKGNSSVASQKEPSAPAKNPANKAAYYAHEAATKNSEGEAEEAVQLAHQALALDPKCAQAWYALGMALGQLNKVGDGIKAMDKAIELRPGEGIYYVDRCKLKELVKDYKGAEKDLDLAQAVNKDLMVIYHERIQVCSKLHEWNKVISDVSYIIPRETKQKHTALLLRAHAYDALKQYDKADKDYLYLLSVWPDDRLLCVDYKSFCQRTGNARGIHKMDERLKSIDSDFGR